MILLTRRRLLCGVAVHGCSRLLAGYQPGWIACVNWAKSKPKRISAALRLYEKSVFNTIHHISSLFKTNNDLTRGPCGASHAKIQIIVSISTMTYDIICNSLVFRPL